MVRFNGLYINQKNVDYIYKDGKIKRKVYKGSRQVYQYGFEPVTFEPSSELKSWTVPLGVYKIHVDCVGSKGYGINGGKGGRVECDLRVNEGDELYIMVGDVPSSNTASYNACDIRTDNTGVTDTTSLESRLIVAGGGGNYINFNGGDGGGTTGGTGAQAANQSTGGAGGTQSAGGVGGLNITGGAGSHGIQGSLGLGGNNNACGGAGYYGGGSGGSARSSGVWYYGGGGGGSSYTDEDLCEEVTHTQGYQDGAGYITISYAED